MTTSAHSMEDLHLLCRLRSTLEAFALAAVRARADWPGVLAALQRRLPGLKSLAQRGGHRAFHEADTALHRALVQAAGVPVLLENWERVVAEIDGWILHVKKAYWPSLLALHREHVFLLEAWASADAGLAEQATHQHLEAGWYRVAAAEGRTPAEADPVERAVSFISTHYASRLEVAWIAANVSFVSASQLTRLFRKKLGMPPHAWIRRLRLERAAELLKASGDDVAAVARRAGYRNLSHFVRDFRVAHGVTPGKYRAGK